MKIKELYEILKKHNNVSTDSRNIEANSIFFALKGDNFNGNEYALDAINKGASYAVIDERKYKTDERILLVEDVLDSLQQLASYHRDQFTFPVIGITGTNGKTTTKELISAALIVKFKTFATKGNLNNHIGVPLTLLSIPLDAEIAIIEMGANHIGEIENLCKIAKPNFGLITNIGKAHIEGFGSYDGVKKAKSELFHFINATNGKLFVNAIDPLLMELSENIQRITYGNENNSKIYGKAESSLDQNYLKVHAQIQNERIEINTKLTGSYNLPNILAAACVANHFRVETNLIKAAIENYTPSNNRSQIKETERNTLILDAYNANPESMRMAIDNFLTLKTSKNKFAILGDMLELGHISNDEHKNIIEKLQTSGFENVIYIGKEFFNLSKKCNIKAFVKVDDAISYIKSTELKDSLILIKGSRGIRLEKTIEVL